VSHQQVVDIISWHSVKEQDIDGAVLDDSLNYDELENLWMVAFGRYLQGKGHPTTDIFSVAAGKKKSDDSMNDAVYRSRLFLEATTASPYLPVDDIDVIRVLSIIFDV
jgi:hypothetical protein